ncbi:MAG: hypothetical protein ABR501_00445 [Pyrinomonadaceae bacterium]
MLSNSREPAGSTFSVAWILAVLVVVLLGLALFYIRQVPQGTDVGGEALVAQAPATPGAEQPGSNAFEQNAQSEAAATQIVTEIKRFQDAAERGMEYKDYDQKLDNLKKELNSTLPTFVRHNPGDEVFRQEVDAALREYTAARNWWKTTMTNSSVFTEAERDERTQRSWTAARTHLTNAEKALTPSIAN